MSKKYVAKLESFHSQTLPTYTYEEKMFDSEEEARKFINNNMGKCERETFWGEPAGREEVVGWELYLKEGCFWTLIEKSA